MGTTVEQKKRKLIDDLAAARLAIFDALEAFPPQRQDDPFLGEWSIKDLLAHLIGWDATNTQAIDEITHGCYPSFFSNFDKDWKTFNARLVQQYKKPRLSDLLADARGSHRQFLGVLEALPAETMVKGKARSQTGRTITIANLLRAEAYDEQEHARQILACVF